MPFVRKKKGKEMDFRERDFGPINPEDDEEERRNFLTVMAAFKYYRFIQFLIQK